MHRPAQPLFALHAVLGALAVAAGAFGAHALRESVPADDLAIWETASRYHLVHALAGVVAAVGLPDAPRARLAGWLFAIGVVVFAGSLYALVLSDARWLGAVTPLGGVAMIGGWLALASAGVGRPSA